MVPWRKLEVALAPDGRELSLLQRGSEYVLRAGTIDLMSSQSHGSEDQLAERGCSGLGPRANVLVGGLGMGFTLRAALDVLAPDAHVLVAELIPAVIAWARGPLADLARRPLEDPRVAVEARDVALVLREEKARFDAILLDVDNGPTAVTQRANKWLYRREGIVAAARALRAGGRLAVWSASDDRAFADRLAEAGLGVETIHVRAHRSGKEGRSSGARQSIFLATRID